MRIYRSIGDLPLGAAGRVVAIGVFDGVHLGHQEIIRRAREIGARRRLPVMVMTFDPNPISVVRPELRTRELTGAGLKSRLLERLAIDELLIVPFTSAFARIRADRFAQMLTAAPLAARAVVVGANFRFGHGGAGTTGMLERFGRSHGLEVEIPDIVSSADGKPISSTRLRRLIARGDVADAAALLGRPHSIDGEVVAGAHRGRAMGVPTANVLPTPLAAMPSRGVYAGRAVLRAGAWPAAINIGVAPTFADAVASVARPEAFLLDYAGPDLYGAPLRLEFLERLRDERAFPSAAELVAQIERDVARTREIAGPATPG